MPLLSFYCRLNNVTFNLINVSNYKQIIKTSCEGGLNKSKNNYLFYAMMSKKDVKEYRPLNQI